MLSGFLFQKRQPSQFKDKESQSTKHIELTIIQSENAFMYKDQLHD